MKSLISDAFAFGLRLQRCSSAQLASRGAELVALGNRLEDAWKAGNMADLRSLRSELCHLARRIGGGLGAGGGVAVRPRSTPCRCVRSSSSGWRSLRAPRESTELSQEVDPWGERLLSGFERLSVKMRF